MMFNFVAWCLGLFAAVLVFALLVMLVVVTSCGEHIATDPGPPSPSGTLVAGDCAPFCGTPTERPVT
ncbi:hypothetical protein AB0N05_37100 [Nocardia sp. NPDC051030]|uniref:hypothetical protein n=1 Tax=Nocardia sp. NPDC051030 TaxID=3155162 RepID=UPI00343F9F1E